MLLDGKGEIDDLWPPVPDHEPLPEQGYALIPLPRLAEALKKDGIFIGVELPNDTDPDVLAAHFDRIAMIAVEFPSFADGRGFSIAKRLRDKGFIGRLRATGPVISDQFAYLLACGFDEVDVPDAVALRQPAEQWIAQLGRVNLAYQRGRTGRASIPDRRRAR